MKNLLAFTLFAAAALLTLTASAGNVDARLSSREAYVGMPITLQITIADAGDYHPPMIPKVDGCDVRSAGTPSQSSQVTIINGRRSESRSVTMQYHVTPRREGAFSVPPLAMEVDGEKVTTQPLRFVATKSVTGDLLFVEIEGGKDKVFVGQPLDLTLKIWVKPFRDGKHGLTLSEGDMWQMISKQSSWGGFTARMKEFAENNQRPGGREVLRDNGEGNERSYYLYEIEATVYPKRPGKIDADDVQVVVNYPTSLGKSRSPFAGFFEDSSFGANSPLSRMMNDDFFGSSFGNRLAVTSTRPIVGEVSVDATEVMPVPTEGRPADYRGAVGRYRIVAEATPATVDTGDPITLNIGIQGTGPMELVQAPPLYELPLLIADFKVADESLAGFVQDDTKVFSTTIRPRREGITEIPPIRFSFFDPVTQSYETVTSEPIAITVNRSESLALDAIVGNSRLSGSEKDAASAGIADLQPDFTNNDAASVLVSMAPKSQIEWWWIFVVSPPIVWLATWLARHRSSIADRLPSLRSAHGRCLTAIERATDGAAITAALTQYIARCCGQSCKTTSSAMGALRACGRSGIANAAESYLQRLEIKDSTSPFFAGAVASRCAGEVTESERAEAIELANELKASFATMIRSRVRLPKGQAPKILHNGAARRALGLLLAMVIAVSADNIMASEGLELSSTQQQTILEEAGHAYAKAIGMVGTDSADTKELFETAAGKYQVLVDSGIQNSELYLNLGNAYLQSGELGRAIANYERASRLAPNHRQLHINLQFANSRVAGQPKSSSEVATTTLQSLTQHTSRINDAIVQIVGMRAVIGTLVIASLVFWGLLIAGTAGRRFPLWRWAAVPLLVLFGSLGSMILTESEAATPLDAVMVADKVVLHAGDGEQFDILTSFDTAQGHRVEVLGQRGNWTQVRALSDQIGWVDSKSVERFDVS